MVAVLLGCGLRRAELAGLAVEHLQQREEHWVVADLVGKGGHLRSSVCETLSTIRLAFSQRARDHVSRVVKVPECVEGSRFSMMDIEDERNHMGAAVGLCYRIGQSGTSAAE
jgi:site-specific recombinase XerC